MLFSSFSDIVGSINFNNRLIYNILSFSPINSVFPKGSGFSLWVHSSLLASGCEGDQFHLLSIFSTFHSALFQVPYVKLCRLFSRKKKSCSISMLSTYSWSLQSLKEQSQFCCLFLQQGQLSTRNYAKAADLFHGTPVPRTIWADLGWQGNNTAPHHW